jgi:Ca-activated chloride channel family protein
VTFGEPALHVLLLLVPLALAAFVYAHRRREGALQGLLSEAALRSLVPAGARAARVWQAVLGVVAILGLGLAASRPQLGFTWQQRTAKGLNIVVILDVSRSMDAADVSPSRIERARRELTDLAGLLKGDSVGLVLVANGAYVRLPLTTDYGTFLWALGDTTTSTIAAQGTSMSGGIDSATQMLTRAGSAGRAIVVVSDGELHDPPEALSAALVRAREADVHIYALGVGNPEGAPIPLAEGGFKKDRQGDVVMSRLDANSLRALAAATGGAYVQAVAGDDDVRGLYEGQIRASLKAEEREVRREQIPNEHYQWPLAVALFALVGSAWAGVGPRRPKAVSGSALALLIGLGWPMSAQAGPREEGLDAMKRLDWPAAIDKLGQARVEAPGDTEVGQGLGQALYRAGRFREAEQVFLSLAAADPDHTPVHLYNAGNAAYRDGRLETAADHFDDAAKRDPELASATRNGAAVKKEIALREQQEQEQQDGQQGGEPQDGQQGGEPQDGQQGGGPQDGQQDAEPQNGQQGAEPQDGQQGAEPQDGQQGAEPQDGQQDAEPQDGQQGQPQGDGQPAGPAVADPGDPDADSGDAAGAIATGDEPGDDRMTAEEAARLVDSVVDGRPRTRIGGDTTEKDW